MENWTHLDSQGRAQMVDVGKKVASHRLARAEGVITMPKRLLQELQSLPKGDALQVGRLAGIMAAKRVGDLIPLCHPLGLDAVTIEWFPEPEQGHLRVIAQATCHGKTGVEMEAMTAVSIALLTIYDMGKATAKGMVIGPIRLLEKKGGKSGHWVCDS